MGWINAGTGGGYKDDFLAEAAGLRHDREKALSLIKIIRQRTGFGGDDRAKALALAYKSGNFEVALEIFDWLEDVDGFEPSISENFERLCLLSLSDVKELCLPIIEQAKAEEKAAAEMWAAKDKAAQEGLKNLSLEQLNQLREMILWGEDNWCDYTDHPDFKNSGLPELNINFHQVYEMVKEKGGK